MIQKYYSRFMHFFREHTGSEWQQLFARTSILASMGVFLLTTIILSLVIFAADNAYAKEALPYVAGAAILCGILYYLIGNRRMVNAGGVALIFLYIALGASLVHCMSVGPASIVLFSAAVILTGFLYGFWCSLVPAALSTSILMGFKASELPTTIQQAALFPRLNSFTAILVIVLILYIFAFAGGALHYYLAQVQERLVAAEQRFAYQRNLLKNEIKTTHIQLRASEAEKIEQLYRFAAIGEISSALTHDLATSLSTLTLEIDDIAAERSNRAIHRARAKLGQINDLLHYTREQIRGHYDAEAFDLVEELDQTVESLRVVAHKCHVDLRWIKPSGTMPWFGERILLRQALTNLIKNAIDSYGQSNTDRVVDVAIQNTHARIWISIKDYGGGIKRADRHRIFEPFYSTKKDGMGMGLYLTKRFIENNMKGSIRLHSTKKTTTFTVELPSLKG